MNEIRKPRFQGDKDPPASWTPTKGQWFAVHNPDTHGSEESCAEDPNKVGAGVFRMKRFLGLTDDKKACKVEYKSTGMPCERDCVVRFIKQEARLMGQVSQIKKLKTISQLHQETSLTYDEELERLKEEKGYYDRETTKPFTWNHRAHNDMLSREAQDAAVEKRTDLLEDFFGENTLARLEERI